MARWTAVRLFEATPNVVWLFGTYGSREVEVMASIDLSALPVLRLYQVHIEGLEARALGLTVMREFVQLGANVVGHHYGARRVVVEGGLRTTGAGKGHVPRPFTIEVTS